MGQPTLLTVLSNDAGPLTKSYRIENGALRKDTNAFLARGSAKRVAVEDVEGLSMLLDCLAPNQGLAFGVPTREEARIVTRDAIHEHPGAIARSRDFFSFSAGPAFLMIDHDADHASAPIPSAEALRDAIISACPALAAAPMLWCASSSSHIRNTATGEAITGLRGQRLYIHIACGSDIERAGAALYQRTWLAGYGHYIVSANGRLLDRSIMDGSVYQPERIDFAAGADCQAPLVQERPAHRMWNVDAPPLDSALILELDGTETAAVKSAQQTQKDKQQPAAAAQRERYVKTEAQTLAEKTGIALERAEEVIRTALESGMLWGDFLLYPEEGKPVTVGDVLDNPNRWHNKRFADPCDPGYRNDRRVAWLNLRSGGQPYLWSWAHGGVRYNLLRQPAKLRVEAGAASFLTDDALAVIRQQGEMFDFAGGELVRVDQGAPFVMNATSLQDYIGRIIRFERFDARKNDYAPVNPPELVSKFLIARDRTRGLPVLEGVTTAPTMRADGTVMDVPGYDPASGLFYSAEESSPLRVPKHPTPDVLKAAFEELWAPVALFPFADDESRGVMFAAILTAAARRGLPTAPGFAFDAPAAGSGKTKLAQYISVLTGGDGAVMAPPRDEGEAGKSMFSALLVGAPAIVWDNVIAPLEYANLNAMLTSDQYYDRVLGVSTMRSVPNRAVFIATGNNIRIQGDAARRILRCRIDAAMESPFTRAFPFDPVTVGRDARHRLTVAALTLMHGYQQSLKHHEPGSLASFEQWDAVVRRCVVWCTEQGITGKVTMTDPLAAVLRGADENPTKALLARVLVCWKAVFGDEFVTARRAMSASVDDFGGEADDAKAKAAEALREALEEVADGDRNYNVMKFGRWLSRHKGEMADGLRLQLKVDSGTRALTWRVG